MFKTFNDKSNDESYIFYAHFNAFLCVKSLMHLNATNKFALPVDQDVHDYFDIRVNYI